MSALYRLVYASKNLLDLPEAEASAEVEHILAASRANNARVDVTGALMFNGGAFAQVLEGPQRGVEETFERIQRDARHGDVTVLECGPVAARGFADWSMAFVGRSARGRLLWSGLAAQSGFDLTRMDGDAVFATLHGLVLEEEGLPPVSNPAAPVLVSASPESAARPLDAARLHEAASRPTALGTSLSEHGDHGAVAALAILKAALADERSRTSRLRGEVDDLRVALAQDRAQGESLRAQRDLWMQRARVLAAALCEDPGEIRRAADLAHAQPPGTATQRAVA